MIGVSHKTILLIIIILMLCVIENKFHHENVGPDKMKKVS